MLRALAIKRFSVSTWILVLALLLSAAFAVRPTPAEAHCDSTNGPVVAAARQALSSGDATPVLAYVQPAAESELLAAFQQTMEVRQLGGQARELADRYFYETAVRLHRAGEGAPYSGLKDLADFGPALTAAEQALETGSLDSLYGVLDQAVRDGLAHQYAAVVEARERATQDGSLAAARERVEAELVFEKYVDGLYQAASGQALHAEGGPEAAAH